MKFLYWHVFWRKRGFSIKESFSQLFIFYEMLLFLFRKRKRHQNPSAFLSHLHTLQSQNKKNNQYLNFDKPPEILWINSLNLHLCASSTWTCTVEFLYTHSCICETSCHVHLKIWNKSAVDTSEAMPRPLICSEVAKFSMICTKYCLVTQYSLCLFGFLV